MNRNRIITIILIVVGVLILAGSVFAVLRYVVFKERVDTIEAIDSGVAGTVDAQGNFTPDEVPADSLHDVMLATPVIAEVESGGVRYEVHYDGNQSLYYNTSTDSFLYGSKSDLREGELQNYPEPAAAAPLVDEEQIFKGAWLYDNAKIQGMLGHLNTVGTEVCRARGTDFLEWVYQYTAGGFCRLIVAEGYIVFGDITGDYVFDIYHY